MDLLYVVILIGSLIFVHELGHFLFAKAFGVKVITFSLGFGPKVLRLRGRETEYCLGLLPFGGYVRMLETSKSDLVLPEDRKRTFESLSLVRRVIVILAGPAMNLIFPALLYFAVYLGEGSYLPPTVGVVLPGHPAFGKLRPGDRILAINGQDVGTFDEVHRIIARSPGQTLRVRVFRDNKHQDVELTVEETIERRDLDIVDRVGTIGIGPSAPQAAIGVSDAQSPAYRAGLRTFDVVTHVAGRPVRRYIDLEAVLADNHGETVPVTYLRVVPVSGALGGFAELGVYESGVVALTPDPAGNDFTERTGMELADLYAATVPEDSYLYKAGLRPGDRLVALDNETIPAWATFIERVTASSEATERAHHVTWRSVGRVGSGTFQIQQDERADTGQGLARLRQRVERVKNWVPLAPEPRVQHPAPVPYALGKAVTQTVEVTRVILVGIMRLAQGRLSLKSLSGPIAIYELTGEERRKGTDNFIWMMAFVSVNLGLLNLLPIPVLDGGHLLLSLIEGLTRRAIPLRAREILHIVGIAILLVLTGLVVHNDLQRRSDSPQPNARSATKATA